ncbi:MAG: hypothetical protein V1744_06130 [Candidatus Altiarchaeota archaeon]
MSKARSSSHKGQLFGADLITAVTLFLIASGLLLLSWNFIKTRLDESTQMRDLEYKTHTAADILVKTQGEPVNWQDNPLSENITSIGLAASDRVILEEKLEALTGIDEMKLRQLLRTDGNKIHVLLKTIDGVNVAMAGQPPVGKQAVKATRIITYKGQPAFLEVTLWTQ